MFDLDIFEALKIARATAAGLQLSDGSIDHAAKPLEALLPKPDLDRFEHGAHLWRLARAGVLMTPAH